MKLTQIRSVSNLTKSRVDKDFFGIHHITNKDIAGLESRLKLPAETISQKYKPLIISRKRMENEESNHDIVFGRVRFDNENLITRHGQYEISNTRKLYETVDVKQRYVPDDSNPEPSDQNQSDEISESTNSMFSETLKITDVNPERAFSDVLRIFQDENAEDKIERYINTPPLTFYFDNVSISSSIEHKPMTHDTCSTEKLSGRLIDDTELVQLINEPMDDKSTRPPLIYDLNKDTQIEDEFQSLDDGKFFDESSSTVPEVSSGQLNALEYIKNLRSGKIEPRVDKLKRHFEDENSYPMRSKILLDSRGYNVYSRQVPDWNKCRHVDILDYLEKSIIYHNYDVLAVNKPYGIASHCENKQENLDMNSLMQELAAKMKIEKIYLAHRLDKTTSGILLFSTSKERAAHLNKLFKSDQIKKSYWCITRGVPDPLCGIIDIPIAEYSVAGKIRSCLAPERENKGEQLAKRFREARRAITEYNTIKYQKNISLVEAKPRTGVKHQIRCHLSFGLNRPILGDHKYSHIGKVAPQTLPVPILNSLRLRQAKARTLPLHLHAKTLVIPGIKANGQTLFLEAPLPQHFTENLRALKLSTKKL